jgi:hypothetical protein
MRKQHMCLGLTNERCGLSPSPRNGMVTSNMRVQRSQPLNRLPEPKPNKTHFQTRCYALGEVLLASFLPDRYAYS